MNFQRGKIWLAIVSGIMLGISFPPFESGVPALFAFVPFFLLFESIEEFGSGIRYAYLTFLVFNFITLYWTGGFVHGEDLYMMIAGGLLVVCHPLFFCLPVIAWIVVRRTFGFKFAILVFPFLWVAFELMHASSQFGFPWLILGNTQTYDLAIIQMASVTGVYGISFWILCINVMAFILLAKLATRTWRPFSPGTIVLTVAIVLVYLAPKIYGSIVLGSKETLRSGGSLPVSVIQPNIDPFEKWEGNAARQLAILQRMTDSAASAHPGLIIWPETAVPFYILHPRNTSSFMELQRKVDASGVPLLTGIPDIYSFKLGDKITGSTKTTPTGEQYETYNSSMLLRPGSEEIQKYAKIILVPFAEHVPFSELLGFLNAAQWNFGLGGWAIGKDTTVFKLDGGVRFSNLICYESIYPAFVASFVKGGAQFLTVITNDSWWGRTSGAYQHVQFASLRAVENRRWVVQCANGGVSAFVDPWGSIHHPTSMYEATVISAAIPLLHELTYYTRQGDWLAEFCAILTLLLLVAAASQRFYRRYRRLQESVPLEKE